MDEKPISKEGLNLFKSSLTSTTSPDYQFKGTSGEHILDSKYDESLRPGEDQVENRAQQQSSAAKLGSGLVNAVVQGGLDIIKDSSYLLDLENYTDLKKSSEEGFHNWLQEGIQSLENKLKLPVYRTKESEGFSPLSAGWWGDNLPSISSSLSMIVPVRGAVKGLSSLGKLMGGDKLIQSIEGASGVYGIGSKLEGVSAAVVSRQMESLMEGGQTFQDTYNKAISSGKSENEAKRIGGEAASQNYKLNWAMIIQDIPQYMVLYKTFKEANGLFSKAALKEGLKTAGSEGAEEMYQFITDKESKRQALINGKVLKDDNTSLADRLIEYSTDGELWTSGFFGALGGVGFGMYGVQQDKKHSEQVNALLESHKGILKGDPDTFNRGVNTFTNVNISSHLANGTLEQFKDGIKAILSNPERIKDEDRVETTTRLKDALKQIDYANSIAGDIMNNTSLSPEQKKLAFNNKLQQRSAELRLQEINSKISPLKGKDMMLDVPIDVLAYKEAKLTLEGIQSIPALAKEAKALNIVINDSERALLKAYPQYKTSDELNASFISSHDDELKKLLTNREVEKAILKSSKDISHKLTSQEEIEKLNKVIQISKKKQEKEERKEYIDELVEKISNGEKLSNPEDLQLYENNKREIEGKLIEKQKNSTNLEGKKVDIEKRRQEELNRKNEQGYSLPMLIKDRKQALDRQNKSRDEAITKGIKDLAPYNQGVGMVAAALNKYEKSVKEINAKYDAELAALNSSKQQLDESAPVINEEEVENRNTSTDNNIVGVLSDAKKTNLFSSNNGLDDGKRPTANRFFRWLNNNSVVGTRLWIVTKNTDSKLYNELLDERANEVDGNGLNARQYEAKYSKDNKSVYPGVYLILVDSNNLPISSEGFYLQTTLTTLERGGSNEYVKITEEDLKKLEVLKKSLQTLTSSTAYFNVSGKSRGHVQTLPVINNKRQSINVEKSFRPISQIEIHIPTIVVNDPGKGMVNGIVVDLGKVYIIGNDRQNPFELIPRTLNSKEIDKVIELLKLGDKKAVERLIFFGVPKKGMGEYTIGFKGNNLVFGEENSLTKEELLDDNKLTPLRNFLATKYVNVNKDYKFNEPFTDIFGVKHITYKEYLLSAENQLFGTDLVPKTEVQIRNQYLVFEPDYKVDDAPEVILAGPSTSEVNSFFSGTTTANDEDYENIELVYEPTHDESGEVILTKSRIKPKIDEIDVYIDKKLGDIKLSEHEALSQQEINDVQRMLPNVPMKLVQGLIENEALGRMRSNVDILLSTLAIKGVAYHEAFHWVSQVILSEKERTTLYSEVRNRLNNQSLTDREAEEILADDFAAYKESGNILKQAPKRNSVFRRLLSILRDFLGMKASDIQTVYERLNRGVYSEEKFIPASPTSKTKMFNALPGKTELFTKQVLDGLDSEYFKLLFAKNKTPDVLFRGANKEKLIDAIYTPGNDKTWLAKQHAYYKGLSDDGVATKHDVNILATYNYILTNWKEVRSKWNERLTSFGFIEELVEENENNSFLTEEDKEALSEHRQGDTGFGEANQKSTLSTMSKSSKLLIRSLPALNKDGSVKINELGLDELVDFSKSYNLLLRELAGIANNYTDVYNKIKELTTIHPEFNTLLTRLGVPSDTTTFEQQWMVQQFTQDMSKNELHSMITIIKPDGTSYIINQNTQTIAERVKDRWKSKLATIANQNESTGRQEISLEGLPKIGKLEDNIKFLAAIGIEFSKEAIPVLENNMEFEKAVQTLSNKIKADKGDVTDLFDNQYNEAGNIRILTTIEADNNNDVIEHSTINATGKSVYSMGLNSYLSEIKNIINNSKTLSDLYQQIPQLNSVTARNSIYLKRLFDVNGNRKAGVDLTLNLNSGINSESDENNTEKYKADTRELTAGEKFLQDITNVLVSGKATVIRPSDKSTDLVMGLSNWENGGKLIVPIEDVANDIDTERIREIFKGYFEDEIRRIAAFRLNGIGKDIAEYQIHGREFSIFKDFQFKKKEVYHQIDSLSELSREEQELNIRNIINSSFDEFFENGVIKYFKENDKQLSNKMVELKVPMLANKEFKKFSYEQLVRAANINDYINTIEQMKLFIGDPAFYSQLFKRTSGAIGQKQSLSTGKQIDEWLNNNNKRADGKIADGNINVVVYEDVKVKSNYYDEYVDSLVESGLTIEEAQSLLTPFTKMDEGDAQGWITLSEYREFAIRLGDTNFWGEKHEIAYDKAINGEELTPEELVLFKVLKSQYFGPQSYDGLFVPTYHKFSLMPIFPQLAKGKNMSALYERMTKEKIGYALFASGSKVGTKVTKENDHEGKPKPRANKFYKDNNVVNDKTSFGSSGEFNNVDKLDVQQVNYRWLGLQVKTSEAHNKVIFGTQMKKLIISNLYNSGVPVVWAKELFDEYNGIISRIVDRELVALTKELGLKGDGTYTAENVKALVDMLKNEATQRDLPNNIKDALQYDIKTGELLYKFDASVVKAKIDNMLMSLINSRVIRQHMNGDSLVQGASSGFEQLGVREVGSNKSLKFYKKGKDGTMHAETMVPMSKNYHPLLKLYKNDLNALNKAIREGKVSDDVLTLIGYRIPTQGLNSMDFFKIVEFLPEHSGAMILPTEIVAKSGGDYDIDKMNIFRSYLNSRGEKVKSKTIEQLSAQWEALKKIPIEKIVGKEDEASKKLISDIFKQDAGLTEDEINQILKEAKIPTKDRFINNYLSKMDNNRIIEIAHQILSHKDNFNSLITPNSTHILTDVVADLRYIDYLNKIKEGETPISPEDYATQYEKNLKNVKYSDQLTLVHKIAQFEKFMLAKDMIGIAAVANTSHTIAQIYNWSINKQLSEDEQIEINFPHHENENGTINIASTFDANNTNKISEVISQIINATVDAAKDPFLFDLKMNMDTLGVYIYLLKTGVRFENIAYMMTQPIIKKYLDELQINKAGYLTTFGKNKSDNQIAKALQDEYSGKLNNKEFERREFSDFNTLRDNLLKKNQETQEFYQDQLQVLEDFLKYKDQAGKLFNAVRAINHDTAGLSENLEGSSTKVEEMRKAIDEKFVNGIERVLNDSFIGKMNLHKTSIDMYGQFYYTQSDDRFKNVRKDVLKTIGVNNRDKKTLLNKLIVNDLINFVVQNYGYLDSKGEPIIGDLSNNLFKGKNSIAQRLLAIKTTKTPSADDLLIRKNPIVEQLFPIINSLKNVKADNQQDNIKLFTRRIDKFKSDQLTAAFRELKDIHPKLAKDIMDLGILQSGLNNSAITYMGLIPYEYYNELVKTAFNNFYKKNGVEQLYKFKQLFFRNNVRNADVAAKMPQGVSKLGNAQWGKNYQLSEYKIPLTKEQREAQAIEDKNREVEETNAFWEGVDGYEPTNIHELNTDINNNKSPVLKKNNNKVVELQKGFVVHKNALSENEQSVILEEAIKQLNTQGYKVKNGVAYAHWGLMWAVNDKGNSGFPVFGKFLKKKPDGTIDLKRAKIDPADKGKNWYEYYTTDQNGNELSQIPDGVKNIIEKIVGFSLDEYDATIINAYGPNTMLSRHIDNTEDISASGFPIVSINLLNSSGFMYSDPSVNPNHYLADKNPGTLNKGDVAVFGDESRYMAHRAIIGEGKDIQLKLANGNEITVNRINITLRRAMPINNKSPQPINNQEVVDELADQSNREYTPENITSLKPNEIFVFGSNAEGVHGKGAALLAKQKFGAKQGQSEGLQGQSYAVITKKNWRVEKSSSLTEIAFGINKFIEFAIEHPENKFYVTKLGSSLAGYSTSEIRNLFDNYQELINDIPDNVILPKEYEVREQPINKEIKPNETYSKLGNKTVSNNVVIKPWSDLKNMTNAFNARGIISTRIPNTEEHFGNPFSHEFGGKLTKTETIKEAVEKYIDWVINSQDNRANWIREELKSGELKNKPILYYKELGEPSHATALDYLINKYNWNVEQPINKEIKPNDKIIWGHPTIGKSFLKEKGNESFITLDDDYADEVNSFIDKHRGTQTRQEYKGRKPKEYNEFMLNLFDRLKVQAEKEGKKLFVSNTNILKERMSEFNKVITMSKEEFKKRFDDRGATYGFEDWKSDIDATVSKVDKSKVINTDKYLSGLLNQPTEITPKIDSSKKIEDKSVGNNETKTNIKDLIGRQFTSDYGLNQGVFNLKKAGIANVQHGNNLYEREFVVLEKIINGKIVKFYGLFKNNTFTAFEDSNKKRISTASTVQFKLLDDKQYSKTQGETNVSKVRQNIIDNLPKEIADAITVVESVPQDILGRNDLFLSMSTILEEKGITNPFLINWFGINLSANLSRKQTINSVQSEAQIEKLANDSYAKLLKTDNPQLQNKNIKESFNQWVKALENYPVVFRDLMLKHAIKNLNKDRRNKFVLQLSAVALQQTYGIAVNKPHELNRIGKLYNQEVLKTVSDAVGHEPSASGKGYWVHIPRTKSNSINDWRISEAKFGSKTQWAVEYTSGNDVNGFDGDVEFFDTEDEARKFIKEKQENKNNSQFKVNVELLKKMSPSTWCTASSMASHYVENYDNYLLVVDGVTVVGIEAYPETIIDIEKRDKRIKEIEEQNKNLITKEVEYKQSENGNWETFYKGTTKKSNPAYSKTKEESIKNYENQKKETLDRNNKELKNLINPKIQVKEVTSRGNNGVASIDHLDDTIAFFEKHNLDLDNESIKNAINARNKGKVDAEISDDFDNGEGNHEEGWYNDEPDYPAEYYQERDEYNYRKEEKDYEARGVNTPEQAIIFINNMEIDRDLSDSFEHLKPELKSNEQVANRLIDFDAHNIYLIDQTLPFYKELAHKAVQSNPVVYAYISLEAKREPRNIALNEAYLRRAANIEDDLPFSKTNDSKIQGYYDAKNDKVVVVAANTPVNEAAKVGIHEVAHRGMLRMAKDLGEIDTLHQVLTSAKPELMKKLPELLKRTGHTSLENLMKDYGFTTDTKEGELKLLMELAARWAETLVDKPKPSWWKELLQSIGKWLEKFTGVTLNEKEVDELIGGFVKYGTKDIGKHKNTSLNNELSFSKINKVENKQSDKIERLYFNRINRLTKELVLAKTPEKREALDKELQYTKSQYNKSIDPHQNKSANLEFAQHTLEIVEEKINRLMKGESSDKYADIEYIEEMLDVWDDFGGVRDKVATLRQLNKPLLEGFLLDEINANKSGDGLLELKEIKAQTKDIGFFKKETGSLLDLANYIASSIGNIIRSSQTKIERQSKEFNALILEKVKEIEKSGRSANDVFKEIIHHNTNTGKKSLIAEKELATKSIEAQEFYKFYQEQLIKLMRLTPVMTYRNDAGELQSFVLDRYFIPNVHKNEGVKGRIKSYSLIKERRSPSYITNEEDKSDIIPLKYIQKIDADKKSDDLANSLYKFGNSVFNYTEMSKTLPKVRLLQREIYNTNYSQVSKPSSSKTKKESNIYKIVEGFINAQVKGEYKKEQFRPTISKYKNAEGDVIERYIDITGTIDGLLRWNSLVTIGLSPVTAISNAIFGDVSNFLEGIGGRFMSNSDLRKARLIFMKQFTNKESVLNKELLNKYNILQELTDYELEESSITSGKTKYIKGDKLVEYMYAPQKYGEYYIQSTSLLAMMIHDELIDKSGELTNKFKNATEAEKEAFFAKVTGVNNKLHGRYNVKESAIAQQNLWYRVISQYKKWLPAALEARTDIKHFDSRLGVIVEGRWNTFGREVLMKLVKGDINSFAYNLFMPLINAKKALASGKLDESDVYNLRKTLSQTTLAIAGMIFYGAATGGDDDKDKKRRKTVFLKTSMLLLDRVQGDVNFFLSPQQILHTIKNPAAVTRTVEDLIRLGVYSNGWWGGEITRAFSNDNKFKGGNAKGRNRLGKAVLDLIHGNRIISDIIKVGNKNALDVYK